MASLADLTFHFFPGEVSLQFGDGRFDSESRYVSAFHFARFLVDAIQKFGEGASEVRYHFLEFPGELVFQCEDDRISVSVTHMTFREIGSADVAEFNAAVRRFVEETFEDLESRYPRIAENPAVITLREDARAIT